MLGYNVEALAQDEGYNKGDRLKSVSCTCPNNKSGFSLKCRADGNLEQCTPTRQGSNACYKVKFSTKPLDLICEGSGIKRDANCSARITFFCRLFLMELHLKTKSYFGIIVTKNGLTHT